MCEATGFLKRAGLNAGDHAIVGAMADLLVHRGPDVGDVWIEETADKLGFGIPLVDWIRGPLAEWVNDLLSESSVSASGLFGAGYVRRYLGLHMRGRRNRRYALGTIIMFQARHRRWA
jgi:asparagine synthetase B (glutamine-hydrolysing)